MRSISVTPSIGKLITLTDPQHELDWDWFWVPLQKEAFNEWKMRASTIEQRALTLDDEC